MRNDTERRFIEARNNYEENVEELSKTIQMLKEDGENDKAEYVEFIMNDIISEKEFETDSTKDSEDHFVSVNQIKRDYVDYEGQKGSEEKVYYEGEDITIRTSCMFEFGRVIVMVEVSGPGNYISGHDVVDWTEFKNFSQKDFENFVNQIVFYAQPEEQAA